MTSLCEKKKGNFPGFVAEAAREHTNWRKHRDGGRARDNWMTPNWERDDNYNYQPKRATP